MEANSRMAVESEPWRDDEPRIRRVRWTNVAGGQDSRARRVA